METDYILLGRLEERDSQMSNGVLSRESLLCVQRMVMELYNEIQELIDG